MDGLTLEGRTALVTGGAGGMGSAIASDLASLGARVLVCDIAEDRAAAVAEEVDGSAYAVDLASRDSTAAFVEDVAQRETVDVLVNNAGWDKVEPFVQNDPAVWD